MIKQKKQGKKYIRHHKVSGLWQIIACKDFGTIKKGTWGGLIESEDNLSHNGNCWICLGAKAKYGAKIQGDAIVAWEAQIIDSVVDGNAFIYGKAVVCQGSHVSDNVEIYDDAFIYDSYIGDKAKVYGNVKISGNTKICGTANVNYDVSTGKITK